MTITEDDPWKEKTIAKTEGSKRKRKMIFELNDTSKAEKLFEGWEETLIYSCLQKVMGKIYVTDASNMDSVYLAEKLGYEFDHEYNAYLVNCAERTH